MQVSYPDPWGGKPISRIILEPQTEDDRRLVAMMAQALQDGGYIRVGLKDGRSIRMDFDRNTLQVVQE